ncbi:hypothetical protein [Streptomyces cadmiisoli]|uniref:hypothetical protein n=1 Tax=Streptomyces cadmiisoli TaxID=2184053 RepID=UPI00365E6149
MLSTATRHVLAHQLHAADACHPWTRHTFSARWGSRNTLLVRLVEPEVVAEATVDVARDSAGR